MLIGIDSSRAFIRDKTGTENYSYHLIKALLRLPESRSHTFVLFIRPNAVLPKELSLYSNVIVREVKWKYLWTQVGLAWETWRKYAVYSIPYTVYKNLDTLWVPAHTLPVLRRPGLRTVVTIHGLEYQWLREYRNWLQRWYLPLSTIYAAKEADFLIAVSEFTQKQLVKELHTNSKKIKVIHEGVEQSMQYRVLSMEYGRSIYTLYGIQNTKYLLFVGSIQPRKNLVALIEAFSLFGKKYPEVKLVIAGGIGWMAEEILQAPSKFGVQEKVVFTGRVSDPELRKLYLGALMYVQPSITEGFGLPVLEAMMYGVPVISSDGGALPEVVGEAGIIVPFKLRTSSNKVNKVRNFVTRLARAMERVTSDQRLRKSLISMGHNRVMEFGWDRVAKETLEVIAGEGYKSY